MRSEQPAGGVERCPAWCAVNHNVASDMLDGVVHESAVPTEFYLVRYQYAGEADEWLYLGDGHHGLDVSPETAQRLRWAIGRLMDSEAERN